MDPYQPDLLTVKEQRLYKKIQADIEYCVYCQPYDDGEAVWIHGEQTELQDLMYQYNVPEKSWDRIISNIVCPYCGNSSFDIASDVGVKTQFDIEVDRHMDDVNKLYGSQVQELEKWLEKYPLLALENKFAKRIRKEIVEKKLPVVTVEGNYYRARKVETSEVFDSKKMYAPPVGKSMEGRFNHAGQNHLYLSSDKEAAIREVINDEPALLVWSLEYEIVKPIPNILDLSYDWSNITPSTSTLLLALNVKKSIGRTDRNIDNWKPDYFLTRFIMDCAKSSGYNGIKYNSTKDLFAHNIVLFHARKTQVIAKGNPQIEIFMDKDDKEKFQSDLLDI